MTVSDFLQALIVKMSARIANEGNKIPTCFCFIKVQFLVRLVKDSKFMPSLSIQKLFTK